MNNPYPNNQYPAPQQPVQQAYAPQPYAPQPFVPREKGFLGTNLMGIIVCALGIAGVAFGIASLAVCGNEFGARFAGSTDAAIAAASLVSGPAPAFGLVMCILAFLFSAGAAVLGLIFGNKLAEEGSPKGVALKVGTVFGFVGVLIFVFAIFVTSCSTCSYCSMKTRAG